MKTYNVGIIGFGVMAGHHVTQLSKGNVRAKAYGAYDTDKARRDAARERGLIAYESAEELLNDENVDIVLVATPNDLHKEYAVKALRAGKHLIVEKPVTLDSAELAEIISEAEKAGRVFTIDQNRRTNRDFVLVKEKIGAGEIGRPYMIESYVEGSRGMFGWRRDRGRGGGMLYDWGIHLIDQLLYMIKEKVTCVYCNAFSVHYPEVDDNFALTLVFESGTVGKINVSTNAYITHPRWYVAGERGTLTVDNWACDGKIVRTKGDHVSLGEAVMTKAGPTRTMAPRDPDSVETIPLSEPEGIIDNLDPVYEQFIDAIEGESLKIAPAQVMRSMKVIDAAFLSAKTGDAVKTTI